jgi:hypothetical protein
MEPAEAIEAAIKSCVERDILVYFLEKHGSEVLNMLFTEWNQDDALAVAREEALEDGIEKGIGIGVEKGIGIGREEGIGIGRNREREELFALWEKGVSLAEAKKILRG